MLWTLGLENCIKIYLWQKYEPVSKFIKVAQDSGTHDSKTEQAEEVEIIDDQFLVILS